MIGLSLLTAGVIAADLPMRNVFKFDKRVWLTGSGAANNRMSLDPAAQYEGQGSVKLVHTGKSSTWYGGVSMTLEPGELQIKFNIKGSAAGKGALRINFNRPGGGNGSAGTWLTQFPVTLDWKSIDLRTRVPQNVGSIQFIFTFDGAENVIHLNNLYFGFAAGDDEILAQDPNSALPFQKCEITKPPRMSMTPMHPVLKGIATVKENGRSVARIMRESNGKSYGAYGFSTTLFNKVSTPGTMLTTVKGTYSGKAGQLINTMNFNLPKKGNASAGSTRNIVKVDNNWNGETFVNVVPVNSAVLQFVFGLNVPVNSKMDIKELKLEYAPDKINISKFTPPSYLNPSWWIKVDQGDCFYISSSAKPAKIRTAIKVAYDDKNLYIGYIGAEPDMKSLVANCTKRDDADLWKDDAFEFFFYDPERNVAKQFTVNSINTQFDCERRQAQAGDPHKPHNWDGTWKSKTWKKYKSWEAVFTIPWKTLGYDGVPATPVMVNFARERSATREYSHWNCYRGDFGEVTSYGTLDFQKNTLTRNRKIEKINYQPKRAKKEFTALLSNEKNDWVGWLWNNEYFLCYQPKAIQQKYDLKTFAPYQKYLLKEWSKAKMTATSMPYTHYKHNTALTFDETYDICKEYNIKYSHLIWVNQSRAAKAGALGYIIWNNRYYHMDPADPQTKVELINAVDAIAADFAKNPKKKEIVKFLTCWDEPTNMVKYIYSRTRNVDRVKAIEEYEAKARAATGFGKYGIGDLQGLEGKDSCFERITFWRYWNNLFAENMKALADRCAEKIPGMEVMTFSRNNCSGLDDVDVALASADNMTVSCDPYPTSARAAYGMGRALYHSGFSVKILRDLAAKGAKVSAYGQAFDYCSGCPTRADLREWASQILKNGADQLKWYSHGSLWQNPDIYNEALDILRQVADLPKLKIPTGTKTAIFYSDYDRWGLNDAPSHAAYTTYALLGEHLGSWFRFVSKNNFDLTGIKQLYIPRMRFTDPELTAKVKEFVNNGGTAIVFDPDFLSYNIDGSSVAERNEFIGTALTGKANVGSSLDYKGQKLPLTEVKTLPVAERNSIHAFDFAALPAGAKVLATYSDGKPAIIERTVGKGKFIFSAVMPFGISDAAITPQGWKAFVADRAAAVKEQVNLPIWNFTLPEVTENKFNIQALK